ncbi:MAG: phosphoribosylanthranilate isomerase, partial [Candidatus Pacebacteria bacterium]|nr:phosphoribosylanthranilate isomerase [Candidatus Paceibacterota bacterium]
MSRVRVKMCGVRSGEDLEAVVRSGADAVGFLVGQVHVSEDFISVDQAADLARSLPPFITPVVTTHLNDAGAILRMCEQVGAGVVQLHGTPKVSDLREVRKRAPASLRFMMAVHVVGEGVHPDVTPYLSMLDGVVVDTLDRDAGRVGGTGTVHDWTVTVTLRSAL